MSEAPKGLPSVEETLRDFEVLLARDVRTQTRKHPQGDVFATCQSAAKALGLSGLPARGAIRDPESVSATAYALGLNAREVVLSGAWWEVDHGTLIVRETASRQPMLVRSHAGRTAMSCARLGDIARSDPLTPALASTLDSQGFALYPSLPDTPLRFRDLIFQGLKPYRFEVWVYLALTLAIALLTYVVPVTSGLVIDHAVPHRNEALLGAVVALVVGSNLVMLALRYTSELMMQRLEGAAGTGLQAAQLERLFRLPLKFFASLNRADLLRRFTGMDSARRSVLRMAVRTSLDVATWVIGLITLMVYHLPGALAVLAACLTSFGLAIWFGKGGRQAFSEGETMSVNVLTVVYELVANMLPIRTFAAERHAFLRWRDNFMEMRRRQVRSSRHSDRFYALQQVLSLVTLSAVFSIVAYATVGSTGAEPTSIGRYVSFVSSVSIVTASAASLASTLMAYFGLKVSADMSQPLRSTTPESSLGRRRPAPVQGDLHMRAVDFKYAEELPPVVSRLSLHIRAGEYIGIVGPSGCGKSTLVRLMLGLISPSSGQVLVDGQDLNTLQMDEVRGAFGVVLQDFRMFPGSILENITAGREIEVDQVLEALDLLGMSGFIKSLPMGLHTMVGEGSSLFSGGQFQLMAMARALVGKPKLLIFDEATSALDNLSVKKVSDVLADLPITRIVLTHRLGTLRTCDRIVVLQEGQIVQEGRYDDLSQIDGPFKTLLHGKT